MDRREFVRMLGAGGVLIGLGVLVGAGCAKEEEPEEGEMPEMPPEPPEPGGGEAPKPEEEGN